jgi:hypothetical protein
VTNGPRCGPHQKSCCCLDESMRKIRPWGGVLLLATAGAYGAWALTR